jgi:hypothetical protein
MRGKGSRIKIRIRMLIWTKIEVMNRSGNEPGAARHAGIGGMELGTSPVIGRRFLLSEEVQSVHWK